MFDNHWTDHEEADELALSAGWRAVVAVLALLAVGSVIGAAAWGVKAFNSEVTRMCAPAVPTPAGGSGGTGADCPPTDR